MASPRIHTPYMCHLHTHGHWWHWWPWRCVPRPPWWPVVASGGGVPSPWPWRCAMAVVCLHGLQFLGGLGHGLHGLGGLLQIWRRWHWWPWWSWQRFNTPPRPLLVAVVVVSSVVASVVCLGLHWCAMVAVCGVVVSSGLNLGGTGGRTSVVVSVW